MAIAPGVYDMTIQRRSDYNLPLQFKDGSDANINLTGYTVQAQVWDVGRECKYADFAVTYTNRATGSISIALTDEQTTTFSPDTLKYDVLLTNPSGLKEYYLEGTITVDEGYTA
tara:strand:- start:213 stop:554 length:342 start_codon:yes stop_codon:yes gene_type:complete